MTGAESKKMYEGIDFRQNPELYRVGVGESGVLIAMPFKAEILPHWRFANPEIARQSAEKIYAMFLDYKQKGEFPGMDLARKFTQMGITRSRRYANHRTGQKYDGPVPEDKKGESGAHGRAVLPNDPDPEKAKSAKEFEVYYKKIMADTEYLKKKNEWKQKYG